MSDPLMQLLVHFDDSPAAVVRLNFARALAAEHGGAVTALYAVTPSLLDVPFAVEAGAAAVTALREIDEQRAAQARQAFEAAIDKTSGVRANWASVEGYPVGTAFHEQALCADLVVLGQRNPSGDNPAGVPFDLIESTLAGSGKPALIVPFCAKKVNAPRDVVIAWKPTREAARAVSAAIPLMAKARSVHVVAWSDGPTEGVAGSRLDLDSWLRLHGIEPRWHREAGPEPEMVGEALLTRAFDLDADLLVMGCYGHSRTREWILGGASRTILESMTLPVLMAH
jgi:nucleotide-binding universal stress UspA family protein